jgi:hypothetical protein
MGMRLQTKTTLLSIFALALLAGLLSSVSMATYVWWTWHQGNHFCATPLSGVVELLFVAMVLFLCLVGTLRLLIKKKNAA